MTDTPLATVDDRPIGMSLLYGTAALVIVLAGLSQVAEIVAPAFLAATLAITVRPLHDWLVRRGVPRVAASITCSGLVLAFIFGLVALLGMSVMQLARELPNYSSRFTGLYTETLKWLQTLGVSTELISDRLSRMDFNSILSAVTNILSGFAQGSTLLVTLIIVVFFLAFDTNRVSERVTWLKRDQPSMATALRDFSIRVRTYWLVATIFGLIVAAMDTVALMVMGIPLAFTWGVFAFVTNYIPNVGFAIGLVPPALMALLANDAGSMIAVIVTYSVINFVMQTLIQPKFTGDAVGLNTTVTFLSLLFWVTIVGSLGALMAVPLTLFVKAILVDSSPRTQWLGVFLQSQDLASEAPPQQMRNPMASASLQASKAKAEQRKNTRRRIRFLRNNR